MEVYKILKNDFYTKGNRGEFRFLRKQLDLVQKKLDEEDLEGALSLLTDDAYIYRPEFNYLRINLLIRLNRIEEALAICNDERFFDFRPIQVQHVALLSVMEKQSDLEQDKLEEVITNEALNGNIQLSEENKTESQMTLNDNITIKQAFSKVNYNSKVFKKN